MVDPQVISQIIGVPVLQIYASPYNEVVLPPSLDELLEFFHVVHQGEERSIAINISALSPPHRMLAKIVQHNLCPIVRRSNLILKTAHDVDFSYFNNNTTRNRTNLYRIMSILRVLIHGECLGCMHQALIKSVLIYPFREMMFL
jgi:hypothetical protein